MIATDYAKALYDAGGTAAHLRALRAALRRRGHEALLPRIFAEYKKLLLSAERLAAHKKTSPEEERTLILLELYEKLINA